MPLLPSDWSYGCQRLRIFEPQTLGGYSDCIVVRERFVVKIPEGADLATTAPLLCSGVTTFSPMQHWPLGTGQRFAVIGLGGLGHMALKLAVHRGAEATVFTTSADKAKDAFAIGAKDVVVWHPAASDPISLVSELANRFDFMLSTIPVRCLTVSPTAPSGRHLGKRRRARGDCRGCRRRRLGPAPLDRRGISSVIVAMRLGCGALPADDDAHTPIALKCLPTRVTASEVETYPSGL